MAAPISLVSSVGSAGSRVTAGVVGGVWSTFTVSVVDAVWPARSVAVPASARAESSPPVHVAGEHVAYAGRGIGTRKLRCDRYCCATRLLRRRPLLGRDRGCGAVEATMTWPWRRWP